ncbi:hypothetical protein [Streptomyces violarus]|uniref:hypothetical protein n=1 Tax=Streptomyces violarus TaxID=67380 RepID=UPI0021BF1FB1|nr:hypothetical protein [Streptomyces violarus]MCT9138640.1 hypothetical protein [Streptomyces violarus]
MASDSGDFATWAGGADDARGRAFRVRSTLLCRPAHALFRHGRRHPTEQLLNAPEEMFTGQWQSRATRLDDYKPYIDQRWQEGCTNAWKLWEEIKEQGYPRGYASVRDYVSRTLRGKPQPVGPRLPSARAVTRWILTHPEALPEGDRLHLKAALANCPELTALAEHVRSFAHMLTHLQGDRLQAPDVRPRRIRTPTQTGSIGVTERHRTTRSGPEPFFGSRLVMTSGVLQAASARSTSMSFGVTLDARLLRVRFLVTKN